MKKRYKKEKRTEQMLHKNHSFLKDFSWYFLGTFVPLLISFIKTPVFTRHFSKEEYGYLGLVSLTFGYLGMLLFSWVGSCIWRFYAKYKESNTLKEFYSNLLFLYVIAFFVLLSLAIGWYILADYYLVKQLIFYSFLYLVFNQLYLFYMIVIRLQGKAKFYTIFQTIRAILGLSTALIIIFIFKTNISALVFSMALIDFFALLFFMLKNPATITFSVTFVTKENLQELLVYGSATLIINIGFLVITSSDRYIIYLFSNLESVGIYDQVYKLSQLSIVVLVTVFFNTINPTLLKELEVNFENSNYLIQKYTKALISFGLPVIVYVSMLSKDIAIIFLGVEFRVGYTIMPFVFFAAYLHGLSNFYGLRLKFSNQLKKMSILIISAAVLNILLNIIFISLYGYKWAAVTTTITYFLLVILFHFNDKEVLRFNKHEFRFTYQLILVLCFQTIIYLIIDNLYELSFLIKLMMIALFVLSYALIFKKRLLETEIPMNI